jgi:hypothetical protein
VTPPKDPKVLAAARKLALWETWRRGELEYLLKPPQRAFYRTLKASKGRRHFFCCSRRWGKSLILTTIAIETALQKTGARILYLAPWSKDAADIVKEASEHVLADCPPEFKPDYNAQSREMLFRNGSVIKFRGVNGETAQFLRGGSADLVVLDECGIMDDLYHVVNEVVTPMTLTRSGRVILATTPARTPGHDSKRLYDEAAKVGTAYEANLLSVTHLTREQKSAALAAAGEDPASVEAILDGKAVPKGTTALREYWCSWVTDSGSAVVPEFDAQAKLEMVQVAERPPYFDAYTAMDPGMVDPTGIIFAYWDVRGQRLVVEDEWVAPNAGTPEIAQAIKTRERGLWGEQQPFMRICDVEKRLISDLIRSFGLPFTQALKNDSKGAVWNMRQMVKSRELIINPRCVNLVRQLENATWNSRVTDFDHDPSAEGVDGHYDLVAALKYLCRMVVRDHNPYPAGYSDPAFGHSRGWRGEAKGDLSSLRPKTGLSRKLDKYVSKLSGRGGGTF